MNKAMLILKESKRYKLVITKHTNHDGNYQILDGKNTVGAYSNKKDALKDFRELNRGKQ